MLCVRTLRSLIWLSIVEKKSPQLARFCNGAAAKVSTMAYTIQETGALYTKDYRLYFSKCIFLGFDM